MGIAVFPWVCCLQPSIFALFLCLSDTGIDWWTSRASHKKPDGVMGGNVFWPRELNSLLDLTEPAILLSAAFLATLIS